MMDDFPLTLGHLLARARDYFPTAEVVSRCGDGVITRESFAELYRRAARLASALTRLGVGRGTRVATLAWNHHRHLEAYLAVPCMGAVLHTLNLRLHPTELGYIARHAGDEVLIVDRSLLPLYEKFAHEVSSIRHVIVIPDDGPTPDGRSDYEALLAAEPDGFAFPQLDERAPCVLCYTSGTTGNPKGVLYSHRALTLHTLALCMADSVGVSESDTLLAVVPMFHANAWGLPFAGVLAGAKLVLPGPKLDPASLVELMASERVTLAAGVPTIWIGILALLDQQPKRFDLSSVRAMLVGGSAAPPSMIEGFWARHQLRVLHAWGMTELSPLGTVARLRRGAPDDARASQGYAVPFVEVRHTGPDGGVLAWDGATMGELEVRGPWVASSYFGGEGRDRFTSDGWFKTGDVVTIDRLGYVRITDRAKDVIKSGGEWISSVALENALMSHPSVLEAAVFAARHPKWDERPVAAVVLKQGATATEAELRDFLDGKFARFWLPDAIVMVPQIPRTSTGKFLKSKLRDELGAILLNR
jgi:fatty-acyl-CoA synthase